MCRRQHSKRDLQNWTPCLQIDIGQNVTLSSLVLGSACLLSLTLNPDALLVLVGICTLIVATRHLKYSSKALGLAAWMEEKSVGTGFSQDLPSQGSQHFYHLF